MSAKYKLARGTKDFLPQEVSTVTLLEKKARKILNIYGYREIRLPLIENRDIFIRGLGKESEVVEKQIFKIEGKGKLCLRPEATAQIARSYIENNLYNQKLNKLFYIGTMFRGERPQKGRLRQFHHIGAEAIGVKSAFLDVELISLARDLLIDFGINSFSLEVNSLGCSKDKEKLTEILKKKLKSKFTLLCKNCQRRYFGNTLRILDCKNPNCKKIVSSLKIGHSYLCKDCSSYFKKVCSYLNNTGIDYKIVPTLVRGLDYYTQTVFEFISKDLGSQNAIGAGGRYDDLIEELGGPNRPACGFALGLERILLLRGKEKLPSLGVFIAYTSEDLSQTAFGLLRDLRKAGISSDMDFKFSSLKSQLRYAQKLEAEFVVIIGEEELKSDSVVLKDMKASSQVLVKIKDLVDVLKATLEDKERLQ